MTAIDYQMAQALVDALAAETFSISAAISNSYDVTNKTDAVSTAEVWVDGTVAHERIARASWSRNVTLEVTAVKRQTKIQESLDSERKTEKNEWLEFIDNDLVSFIQSEKISTKLPVSVTFSERLSKQHLAAALFFTRFQITYPLV